MPDRCPTALLMEKPLAFASSPLAIVFTEISCQPATKRSRAKPEWCLRLAKVHTSARRSLPCTETGRWRELDSCMSSDALLMNVFCYPRVLWTARLAQMLGLEPGLVPHFGFRPRVPLENDRCDRTEVDMRVGDLLVEAKLTESDFQHAEKFKPQTTNRYSSYQLIRNVLAAYASRCSAHPRPS